MSEFNPATQEQLKDIESAAQHIIEMAGVEKVSPSSDIAFISATIGVSSPELTAEASAEALPTIKINVPKDEDSVKWKYEISYGLQDEDKSIHLLLGEDKILGRHVIVTPYNGESSDVLSEEKANKLLFDLKSQIDQAS